MSVIPPLPTGPESDEPTPAVAPKEFAPAPWNILDVTVGFFATIPAAVAVLFVFMFLMKALGVGEKDLAFRYGAFILSELALLAAPFGASLLTRGGRRSLGLVATRFRGVVEGVALGLGMWVLNAGYSLGMDRLAPEIAKKMQAEGLKQMEALAGPPLLLVVAAVLVAPFCEEMFFRAFVFGGLRRRLGFAVASGLAAAVFALVHFMAWSTIPLFFIGLACAGMYERHRSIVAAVSVHAAFNAASLAMFFAFGI